MYREPRTAFMRPRTGCQACRTTHLKCVRRAGRDRCDRCFHADQECVVSSGYLFKKVKTTYRRTDAGKTVKQALGNGNAQTWVAVPSELTFVDGLEAGTVERPAEAAEKARNDGLMTIRAGNPLSRSERNAIEEDVGSNLANPPAYRSSDMSDSASNKPWPFQNEREALLFAHYIKRLSPSIDVLDPNRSFGKVVPRLAVSQPLILNAIFAVASLHLSLLNGTVDIESPPYLDKSLQQLKQILAMPDSHEDDALLAGVVLLRNYEEMSPQDDNIHILGGQRLLSLISGYSAMGGLREAANWILLRQHIYIALTTRSPVRLDLSLYERSKHLHDGVTKHGPIVWCCCLLVWSMPRTV